ncbi:MAG: riboflavin synthase [Lentisphaerae bacterium]|nr:riboflavin synthase [Lentisphaerota bacterium]
MFTGLVQGMGKIISRSGGKLIIMPDVPLADMVYGESIAVNGCCLTLENHSGRELTFHTLEESLRRTNLGRLPVGSAVNLERALRLGDRLGGHIVQGHVDTAARVLECKKTADGDFKLAVALDPEFANLVVVKGGIAVDGVSLTVVEAERDFFSVRLIPVTLQETALRERTPGEYVNLEFDVVGRYILRMMEQRDDSAGKSSGITMETLLEAGFL